MIIDRSLARLVRRGLGPALAILLAFAPGAVAAGIYQWTDADGAIHFTDDPGKIPAKFRDTAQQLRPPDEPSEPTSRPSADIERESPGPESEREPAPAPKPEPTAEEEPVSAAPSEALDARGRNEEWWRQRVKEWRDKKADAEERLADAQERLGQERFLNATTGNMQRIQDISAEVEMYESQIREADNMLTDVLPDEARRAQAPPGWLRD
jgi:hypothetical protein